MKLFYDHLIDRGRLTSLIKHQAKTKNEEKQMLKMLDELLHSTVLDVILFHLDEKHHEEFLTMLHQTPHSEEVLIYLKQKGHPEIERKIKKEVKKLTEKILGEIGD